VKGLEQIMVVYRASDAAYEDAYSKVNPFVKTPNSKKI